jgi:site-specific DNA-cytosine methylase
VFDAEIPSEPKAVIGFAGGGGSSAAYKAATGRDPDAALNHWILAVLAHQRNHPATEHHCADIFEADPRTILPGAHLHFGWFSPDCTDHSKAKGTAPKSERIRGLGWAILPWARLRRPDVIIIENVEEWAQWGPVYRCPDDWRAAGVPGKVGEPIKALRGETFQRLIKRFRRCGYDHIGWRELVSADYGGWTTRKRLFVVLCRRPFAWPKRTHAPRHLADKLGLKPWRGAWEKLDFSLPCPSILMDAEEARELKRTTGVSCRRPAGRQHPEAGGARDRTLRHRLGRAVHCAHYAQRVGRRAGHQRCRADRHVHDVQGRRVRDRGPAGRALSGAALWRAGGPGAALPVGARTGAHARPGRQRGLARGDPPASGEHTGRGRRCDRPRTDRDRPWPSGRRRSLPEQPVRLQHLRWARRPGPPGKDLGLGQPSRPSGL